MSSENLSIDGNNSEDEFDKHFAEFAAGKGKPPTTEAAPDTATQSEGNDPGTEDGGEQKPPETAPESVTSDAQPDGGEQKPPAEQQAPDPWASAPDELKALYEAQRQRAEQAEHRARSDAARVSALTRKLITVSGGAPAPQETGAEPTDAQKALDEKVKQLREEFPDYAGPLVDLIEAQRSELSSVRQQIRAVSAEQQAASVATEMQALEVRHPDWREVAARPEFGHWLQEQPASVQNLAASWDAKETGVVLTLFKLEAGLTTEGQRQEPKPAPAAEVKPEAAAADATRSRQLEGGADVRSKPNNVASGAPDDFDAAFAHFAAKQDEKLQRQRGR
jgi:hypothetical protein